MYNQLIDIREKLLKFNPYFTNGFGLYFVDPVNGMFLSYEEEKSIHIQDDLGNYFFFLLEENTSASNSDKIIYELKTPLKLVCVFSKIDPLKLRNCILNTLTGINEISSNTINTVKTLMQDSEEDVLLSVLKSLGNLEVSSFSFQLTERIVRNECICKPCEDCGLQDN